MYCLDTKIVIAVLKNEPANFIRRFERELVKGNLAVSAIVLFELYYGIANSGRRAQNAQRLKAFLQAPIDVLPFDEGDAEEAGRIRAALKKTGAPVGAYDILIAAQASRRDATLITANAREFSHVPELRIENWIERYA
jgi:tRNA(fMet)-specific endonuclease VapC